VSDAQPTHPQHETETEVIPPVTSGDGMASTRELPVVEDEATVVTPPPPPQPQPQPQVSAPRTEPPAPVPATPTPAAPRRPLAIAAMVAVAFLAVVAGVVAIRGFGSDNSASGSAVKLASTITSVDASGGSGFRRDGAAWRTQTYVSADFGGLKDGVGLLLDLGASRAVSTVTFDVTGGPIGVELRAGNSASSSASGYQRVAADPSASGSTTLTVKGGAEHRYWLIWVTRLGAGDGGYRAVIQAPTALGPRS
jgi:hypothetical protein